MKKLKTTFVDSASTKPVGEPIDGLLVPAFTGMSFESDKRIRYKVTEVELIDSKDTLELFVTVEQCKTQ